MAILESSKCMNDLFYLDNIMNSVLIDTSVGWTAMFFLPFLNKVYNSGFWKWLFLKVKLYIHLYHLVNFMNSDLFNDLSERKEIWCVYL